MSTQSRAPTSDESVSGTWSGSAGSRYTVVNDYPDVIDYLTHGTAAGNLAFGFSALTVPAGSTINSVTVEYYCNESSSGNNRIYARLKVGGNYYNSVGYVNPATGAAAYRSEAWTQNPKTVAAWTVDDVNGVGSNALQAFGWYTSDANPTWNVFSIQVTVDYTAGAVTGQASIDATSTLTAVGQVTRNGQTTIPATSTLTALGYLTLMGAATLAATSTLGAVGNRVQNAGAVLAATSTVLAQGSLGSTVLGAALVESTSTASFIGRLLLQATSSIAAGSTVLTAGLRVLVSSALSAAQTALVAVGVRTLHAGSTVAVQAVVTAAPENEDFVVPVIISHHHVIGPLQGRTKKRRR